MKKTLLFLLIIFASLSLFGQGQNHQWLIGNWPPPFFTGRMLFDSASYSYNTEVRKMGFWGTDATICDVQGNFLMSSNGIWIANANNDTMMNGTGLNPGTFTSQNSDGLIIPYANIFLPFPGDSTKYLLLHHTAEFDGQSYPSLGLFKSSIDLTLDNGLGAVIAKNENILSDSLNWGIGACKHANGRDWWIVMSKLNSGILYTLLLTPQGVINVFQHNLFQPNVAYNVPQPTFSPDGTKFGYTYYYHGTTDTSYARFFDFDRCTGIFSNSRSFNFYPSGFIWGFSFSPNSKLAYCNTSGHIFQMNIDSMSIDTVATYDGFMSGTPVTNQTTFMFEYLAANGKTYLTSGSSVQHIHEINYPDSVGLACDVQQHAIPLGVWHFRSVPNHPNYNLGPVLGSVCDTLSVGIPEQEHDFRFGISPNPTTDGYINIIYLLPQNKAGVFEVYNMTGQLVYKMNLPHWSTLQQIKLPELSSGVYTCVVRSGYERVGRKLVVMK